MKKAKLFSLGIVAVAGLTLLGACGGGNSGSTDSTGGGSADGTTDAAHSVAIVTDIGGVDDRSFNQSAWEGLEAWGKNTESLAVLVVMTTCNQMKHQNTQQT